MLLISISGKAAAAAGQQNAPLAALNWHLSGSDRYAVCDTVFECGQRETHPHPAVLFTHLICYPSYAEETGIREKTLFIDDNAAAPEDESGSLARKRIICHCPTITDAMSEKSSVRLEEQRLYSPRKGFAR